MKARQQNLWVVQSVAGSLPLTPELSFDTRQQCPKSSFISKVQNDEGPNIAENHIKATILALSSQLPSTDSAEEAQ